VAKCPHRRGGLKKNKLRAGNDTANDTWKSTPGPGVMYPGGGGAPPPPLPSPLGLLLPGRPIRTDFTQVSPTRWVITVEAPALISDLAVFAMPGCALPPGAGLAFFWSLPPHMDWVALGASVGAGSQSAIFRTGWPSTPAVAASPVVQVGVSIEAADTAASMGVAASSDKGLAQLLAADLGNFLGSFATVDPALGERLLVPPSALQAWLKRIEERTRSDPNLHFLRRG